MGAAAGLPRGGGPDLREAFPRMRRLERLDRDFVQGLEDLQLKARGFARDRLRGAALEVDRRCEQDPSYFDWELVREGGRRELLDLLVPREVGGGGSLATGCAIVMEELCAACPGLALIFGAHGLGISPLLLDGPRHWDVLAGLAASSAAPEPPLMACALTEPDAGTDVEDVELLARARIGSEARRVPGGYSLNGTKRFISNGSVARWVTVLMPVDPRRPRQTWTCFLVDARSRGFSVIRAEHKMGQRACPAAELHFEEVFVPEERVVGRVGDGAGATLIVLAASRPPVGAIATGIARGAYERLLRWLREDPEAAGLLGRQAVQLRLAAMAERIQIARQAYMDAAMELDFAVLGGAAQHPLMRGLRFMPNRAFGWAGVRRALDSERFREQLVRIFNRVTDDAAITRSLGLSSLAKARGGDVAMAVTDEALAVAGLADGPIGAELEKLWRDAKLCQIYEGTNQLNRLEIYKTLILGEAMPALPRPARRPRGTGLPA